MLAAALEDAGIAGEVWPLSEHARAIHERELADLARRTRLAIDQRGLIGRGGLVDPPSSIAGAIDHTNARPATVPSRPRAQSPAAGVPVAGEAGRGDAGRGDAGRGDAGRGEAGRDSPPVSRSALAEIVGIELAIDAAGIPLTVVCWVPGELVLRAPPPRVHPWSFELPIVVARCLLDRASVATLRVRDVVVVEPGLSLVVGDGAFGLTASPQDLEARVATGYVPAVTPADDAGLPVTVQLGTVRLSLRRLGELAVGEVIGLGRPLAGPYEIHAGGRVIGQGELVDLDGEIGIRIMSLTQE